MPNVSGKGKRSGSAGAKVGDCSFKGMMAMATELTGFGAFEGIAGLELSKVEIVSSKTGAKAAEYEAALEYFGKAVAITFVDGELACDIDDGTYTGAGTIGDGTFAETVGTDKDEVKIKS